MANKNDQPTQIDVEGLFKDLRTKGEAKFKDHEIKEHKVTDLMKKYFVKEWYDKWKYDLYFAEYNIPAGEEFDKAVDEIVEYWKDKCSDPKEAIADCKKYLKEAGFDKTTGAKITISMNTFDCAEYERELTR